MKVIHKYPLYPAGLQAVHLPIGAAILTAQWQGHGIALWAEVDDDAPTESREIEVFGTGQPMRPGSRQYIATAQDPVSGEVWHVFERTG